MRHHKLNSLASKKGIITLFFLAHIVLLLMMLFTFPVINDKLGTLAFDLKTFGYSYDEVVIMIQNLDDSTIDLYLFPQLFLLDVLYPVLLALFLSTLIVRLMNLIGLRSNFVYSNLFLLPFIAMGIDYLENILIAMMITGTIEISESIVNLSSTFTQLKGLFTTISWLVILGLVVVWLVNKARRKNVVNS